MSTSTLNLTRLIQKRTDFSHEIAESIQNLSTLNYILTGIQNIEQNSGQVSDSEKPGQIEDPVSGLIHEINNEQLRLARIKDRFSKDGIRIGVLGLARQGKSTILQSLSGLDSRLIPKDNGLHCTAATSFITSSQQDRITAIVKFHSRDTFFSNTILPYFKELNLSPVPKNLAEFEVSPLPPLHLNDSAATAQYKKLNEYHHHAAEYSYLLTGITKQIGIEEISEYVVHHDANQILVYKHLAVEHVEISCPFPHAKAEKLTLIDMPGIGDVSIINESKRLKKLVAMVDFLLFVRKPDPLGDSWSPVDLYLYNACNKAITDLDIPNLNIQDNSFLVLNHVKITPTADNLGNCNAMQAAIESHGMKFLETAILDCTDQRTVSNKVFGEVSSFINKINDLDDQIIARSRENISAILKRIKQMVNANERTELEDDPVDLHAFKEMFNHLWSIQTNSFENLLKQKYSLCLVPNELIYDHFKKTKENIKLLLNKLTETDVQLARNAVGSYNKAYEDFLNEYKTHITNEFIKLDAILLQVLNGIKNEVYEILKTQGKLSYMATGETPFDAALIKEVNNISELKNSVVSFVNFQLSYLGFLHFKIREYLDILTPDFLEIRLSREDTAEDILKYIKHSVEACLYKIEKEFYIWSQDINKISFSLLEEFLNQIFRSKHAKDNWEIFYQMNLYKIWPEKYGNIKDKQHQYGRLRQFLNKSNEFVGENTATIYE